MAEDHDGEHGDGGHDHGIDRDERYPPGETRTTAPQQEYTTRGVGVGLAVLAVGIAIAYLVPALA